MAPHHYSATTQALHFFHIHTQRNKESYLLSLSFCSFPSFRRYLSGKDKHMHTHTHTHGLFRYLFFCYFFSVMQQRMNDEPFSLFFSTIYTPTDTLTFSSFQITILDSHFKTYTLASSLHSYTHKQVHSDPHPHLCYFHLPLLPTKPQHCCLLGEKIGEKPCHHITIVTIEHIDERGEGDNVEEKVHAGCFLFVLVCVCVWIEHIDEGGGRRQGRKRGPRGFFICVCVSECM